jgi:hypothetical protein
LQRIRVIASEAKQSSAREKRAKQEIAASAANSAFL